MRYHLLKRSKMNVEVAKLKKAAQYYTARMQRIHFQIWAVSFLSQRRTKCKPIKSFFIRPV
jgi:hypothetical protein